MPKILTLFGTRPEVIKLAPVIRHLETDPASVHTVNVASGQHEELVTPFVRLFGLRVDHHLRVMEPAQSPSRVCARVLAAMDPLLEREEPDLLLVQGDTTTALAGALAGFHRRIPVGHVEAGLRSGDAYSPYPEEMNRRLISRLATYHFAATALNRETLLSEGVSPSCIFLTGNPVVDALHMILASPRPSASLERLLGATDGLRRIVLTTHRRESLGPVMVENLGVLRRFVEQHADVALIFPVHPNPAVVEASAAAFARERRVHLVPPLGYEDFILLLSRAWLIVSDSGGVQEEAPSLGRPVLVIRENTERPEALASGIARLVGGRPERLAMMLEEAWARGSWVDRAAAVENPYGRGDSGRRIAELVVALLNRPLRAVQEEPA